MSHVFVNSGEQPQRTRLQLGVVDILTPLTRAEGGYLGSVIPYGGIVWSTNNDGPDIEMMMRTFNRTPAIGVATGTRTATTATVNKRHAIGPCELLLFFATQHSRDHLTGRLVSDAVALADDQADPGLHVMMQHALELVLGQFPSIQTSSIKQIEFEREEVVVSIPQITVWQQTYRVQFTNFMDSGGQFRDAKQLLTSIGWRVTTDPDDTLPPAEPNAPPETAVDADTEALNP